MVNIVLVNPKIPQNVGNIGRTCVALGATLHIILPIPFEISDKQIKRAGLDYWPDLKLFIWDNLEHFYINHPFGQNHFFATTKTKKLYFDFKFSDGNYFYFGSEDSGLPIELMNKNPDNMFTLPMTKGTRSLNVANTVAIVGYEVLRQNISDFKTRFSDG